MLFMVRWFLRPAEGNGVAAGAVPLDQMSWMPSITLIENNKVVDTQFTFNPVLGALAN